MTLGFDVKREAKRFALNYVHSDLRISAAVSLEGLLKRATAAENEAAARLAPPVTARAIRARVEQ